MGTINVVAYDPQWPEQFEELRSIFAAALANHIIAIEHVGSTAIPGSVAKPVLDIDIIVADEIHLNKVIPVIALLGYRYMGEQGIPGRYVFKAVSKKSPDTNTGILRPKHHLYCCLENSISLTNHLLFRDALRNDDNLVRRYGELKKSLALTAADMDVYVEGKSDFIAGVLQLAGLSEKHIKNITIQNKQK